MFSGETVSGTVSLITQDSVTISTTGDYGLEKSLQLSLDDIRSLEVRESTIGTKAAAVSLAVVVAFVLWISQWEMITY